MGCFELLFEKIRYRLVQKWERKKRHELFQEYY